MSMKSEHAVRMNIGEFASRSRLSAKALRLYDELGLLPPAEVDEDSGYRFYEPGQLEQARLIAALRQLQASLAEIKAILAVGRAEGAERIRQFWAEAERDHAARRALAAYLIDDLSGKRAVMYDVNTRDVPERTLLCLKRHVADEQEQWAFGKEFIGVLRRHKLPRMEGRAGAWFCIYWGEVNEDSDGPVEWCRPIPPDQAEALAARCPELTLRAEPAHREAFVELGHYGQVGPADWQVISRSLHAWADRHPVRPIDLGSRLTFLLSDPPDEVTGPELDFAVPFEGPMAP
jgi:DNA-binding transcriptional MerR regulator